MAAKRVQADDIVKMNELYKVIGTYAGVAREVGFSAGTVKRYIIADYVPQASMIPIEKREFVVPAMGELVYPKNWNDFLKLTDEEINDIKELQKNISI